MRLRYVAGYVCGHVGFEGTAATPSQRRAASSVVRCSSFPHGGIVCRRGAELFELGHNQITISIKYVRLNQTIQTDSPNAFPSRKIIMVRDHDIDQDVEIMT